MIGSEPQILCIGTTWVEGRTSAEKVHEMPSPGAELQFSQRGLDSSFLVTLNLILQGITYTDVARSSRTEEPVPLEVRRIGGAQVADQAVHIYEVSGGFCRRLAELSPARIQQVAAEWYALQGHVTKGARAGRVEYRAEIIQNLAAMAQVALARSTRMLLKVVYKAES